MAALNRFQPPSAIGQAQFHITTSGLTCNAHCSVGPVLTQKMLQFHSALDCAVQIQFLKPDIYQFYVIQLFNKIKSNCSVLLFLITVIACVLNSINKTFI